MTRCCTRNVAVALSLGLAACGIVVGGCRRPETPTAPATTAPSVTLDTPQDAARTLLQLLRAHLDARARDDKAAAAENLAQVELNVAARDAIVAREVHALGQPVKDEARLLRTRVENWAALIAYYTTFDFDRMQLEPGAGPKRQTVRVPARGPHDQAVIRVSCIQGDDGRWRVRIIDFAGPTPPATLPAATQPQPTPAP